MSMTDSKLVDSSVWIAYLTNGKYNDIIDAEEILLISAISLFEIKRKLIKNKIPSDAINKSMDFVRKRSLILNLDAELAEKAADISEKHELAAVDSVIYATALMNDAALFTLDNDFRGIDKVTVMAD